MRAKSENALQFDVAMAGMLACPACRGDLRVEEERLGCGGCGRRYPIVEGIPVLIVERAEMGPKS